MNKETLKRLAIQCGLPDFSHESNIECFLDIFNVEVFANAIIAEYQASLVPVESVSTVNMQYEYVESFDSQMLVASDDVIETLYALPLLPIKETE